MISRLVFVDGDYQDALSSGAALKEYGVITETGVTFRIEDNDTVLEPIHLIFTHAKHTKKMQHQIHVGANSRVTIIEEYLGDHTEIDTTTELHAGNNAHIEYYKIQKEDTTAKYLANVIIQQEANSQVTTFVLAHGGGTAKETITATQSGDGAETYLYGFYHLNKKDQQSDHQLQVNHEASHGTSVMLYKGILENKSRAGFTGKVVVQKGTKQINAHQANHNLLLSKEAEVSGRPELEIYSDDVKCTHGATVGQLDTDALFYLCSRGIEKQEAIKILTRSFSADVIEKIGNTWIRNYIENRVGSYDEL